MLKQISVFTQNKKGAMQKLLAVLAEKDINVLGSVTNDSAEYGIVRMVVSDTEAAVSALRAADYIVSTVDVLGVELPDVPGSLERVLRSLLEINVFVDYIYLTFNRESASPMIILHTDSEQEVEAALIKRGFTCR